jgi:hypothetical protein
MPTEPDGARFYDERKRNRGWASRVARRESALGRLVVLEISTTDPALLDFLRALDKAPLWVEGPGESGVKYRFAWASAYENGATVRVQGILQNA